MEQGEILNLVEVTLHMPLSSPTPLSLPPPSDSLFPPPLPHPLSLPSPFLPFSSPPSVSTYPKEFLILLMMFHSSILQIYVIQRVLESEVAVFSFC